MYGHSIPLSLDAFLNKNGYPVEIAEYALRKPDAVSDGDLDSLFIPDKHSVVLSRATIAVMIDWASKVIPFKILNADDIIEINLYLTEYIRQLSDFRDIEEARAYLVKAKHLQSELQRSVVILAKTRPDAKRVIQARVLGDLFTSKIQRPANDSLI